MFARTQLLKVTVPFQKLGRLRRGRKTFWRSTGVFAYYALLCGFLKPLAIWIVQEVAVKV